MLCKHAAALVDDRLLILGGGALCFSFGACFNDTIALDIVRGEACRAGGALDFRVCGAAVASAEAPALVAPAPPVEPAVVSGGIACQVCGACFASRNKLNQHLQHSGHNKK